MSVKRILLAGAIFAALPFVAKAQEAQAGGTFTSENLSVTPEPATLVLVATGLVAAVAIRRRKK